MMSNRKIDKKRAAEKLPTARKKAIKKGRVSLYRTLCRKKLDYLYIKWGVLSS